MSIETPNREWAAALVAPVVAGPFTENLQSSRGFKNFTRVSAGQYVLTLEQAVAFEQVVVTLLPPPNTQVVPGSQLQSDGKIFVSFLSMATGTPVDVAFFAVRVLVFAEGEGAGITPPNVPASPAPLSPSSAGIVAGMSHVYWIDKDWVGTATPNGSLAAPFRSLTAAAAAVPMMSLSGNGLETWTLIASPGEYDEDLPINITRRRIILGSFGRLVIGTTGDSGDPVVRRNITITGSDATIEDNYVGFTLTSFVDTTDQDFGAPMAGPIVTGQIVNNVVGVGGFSQIEIHGMVFGDTGTWSVPAGTAYTDAGATGTPIITFYIAQAAFLGAFASQFGAIQYGNNVHFGGDVTLQGYLAMRECSFEGNFSFLTGPEGLGFFNQAPYGITQSRFAAGKTITSTGGVAPFNYLVVDAETNYTIVNNGVTVTLFATSKKLIVSLPPMSTYRFGATFAGGDTNKIALAGGTALATPATVASAATGQVVERVDILTSLSWNSDTASGTTTVRLYKNNALQQTLVLTGVKGQIALTAPLRVAIGDLLSLDYASGTAPGGLALSLTS